MPCKHTHTQQARACCAGAAQMREAVEDAQRERLEAQARAQQAELKSQEAQDAMSQVRAGGGAVCATERRATRPFAPHALLWSKRHSAPPGWASPLCGASQAQELYTDLNRQYSELCEQLEALKGSRQGGGGGAAGGGAELGKQVEDLQAQVSGSGLCGDCWSGAAELAPRSGGRAGKQGGSRRVGAVRASASCAMHERAHAHGLRAEGRDGGQL